MRQANIHSSGFGSDLVGAGRRVTGRSVRRLGILYAWHWQSHRERIMKRAAFISVAVVCSACSSTSTSQPSETSDQIVTTSGPLRLTVTDFPTMGGVMWALPSAEVGTSSVTVQNTRYGSLCAVAVSGNAAVRPGSVVLHIRFAERLTSCVAEIRALKYEPQISGLSGPYDLTVIHDQNNRADTLVQRKITVP
jgi:hypothetical protein